MRSLRHGVSNPGHTNWRQVVHFRVEITPPCPMHVISKQTYPSYLSAYLSSQPEYFQEPHWKSFGLPVIFRVNRQICISIVDLWSQYPSPGWYMQLHTPDSKVHGANMGPTWVLSAPDGPLVGPMNLAIRDVINQPLKWRIRIIITRSHHVRGGGLTAWTRIQLPAHKNPSLWHVEYCCVCDDAATVLTWHRIQEIIPSIHDNPKMGLNRSNVERFGPNSDVLKFVNTPRGSWQYLFNVIDFIVLGWHWKRDKS